MPVITNFLEDLRLHFLGKLRELGASDLPKDRNDTTGACVGYFNVLRKRIPRRPRKVHAAPALVDALSSAQRDRLSEIIAACEAGEDLTPRLSKRALSPLYNDRLLNDWGIHHLHVGPEETPHGKDLLFAMVRDDAMYLIGWRAHGAKHFADQDLVQIVHDNWPEIICSEIAPGVVPGSSTLGVLAPEDRSALRGICNDRRTGTYFTTLTQVKDGTTYAPIGGGAGADGTSFHVVDQRNREMERAAQTEMWVRENTHFVQRHLLGSPNLLIHLLGFQDLRLEYLPQRFPYASSVREFHTGIIVDIPDSMHLPRMYDADEYECSAGKTNLATRIGTGDSDEHG